MVPKRIFFFWTGDTMSWLRYMTIVSFKKLNPDWKVQLYRSSNKGNNKKTWNCPVTQDFYNYKSSDNYLSKLEQLGIEILPWKLSKDNDDSWDDKVGPSHKSNFFKWEQLSKEGGIYADMDILFIDSINKFYDKIKNYSMGLTYYKKYFSIGLLISEPNNDFFKAIFNHAFKTYTPARYQCVGVECLYNFLFKANSYTNHNKEINWNYIFRHDLIQKILSKFSHQKIYNIDMDIVYPWKFDEMKFVFEKDYNNGITNITNNTIGIHWYAGDSISQKYNNSMNENNFMNYKNLISYYSKKILC